MRERGKKRWPPSSPAAAVAVARAPTHTHIHTHRPRDALFSRRRTYAARLSTTALSALSSLAMWPSRSEPFRTTWRGDRLLAHIPGGQRAALQVAPTVRLNKPCLRVAAVNHWSIEFQRAKVSLAIVEFQRPKPPLSQKSLSLRLNRRIPLPSSSAPSSPPGSISSAFFFPSFFCSG